MFYFKHNYVDLSSHSEWYDVKWFIVEKLQTSNVSFHLTAYMDLAKQVFKFTFKAIILSQNYHKTMFIIKHILVDFNEIIRTIKSLNIWLISPLSCFAKMMHFHQISLRIIIELC